MIMKSTLKCLGLTAAAAFVIGGSACSDSHDGVRPSNNPIIFSAIAPLEPRTQTENEGLKEFSTVAFSEGDEYLNTKVVYDQGTWSYSPQKYWPASGQLNFFSYSPSEINPHGASSGTADIPGFISKGNTDLLYAVNIFNERPENSVVNVNFRHALSKLSFRFKSKSGLENVRIIMISVDILNIMTQGDFSFPRSTTLQSEDTGYGSWNGLGEKSKKLSVWNSYGNTLNNEFDNYRTENGYQYAIPQSLPEFNPNDLENTPCLAVLCRMEDCVTGVRLWPDPSFENGDYIYFPLGNATQPFEWEIGKAYRYNVEIGLPESVGNIISFDVTVDKFMNFGDINNNNN